MRQPPPNACNIEMEVPFFDVDTLNVVWHGHYYKYVDIGRTMLLREKGIDFGRPSLHGHKAYVIETKCRHASPLRYGDRFRVSTWIEDCENRVNVSFEIFNLTTNRRAAYGHTLLASVGPDGELLLEVPDVIRKLLQ